MSHCTFDFKGDYNALVLFFKEHPYLLLAFFVLQIASGVAVEKASRPRLSFVQRLFMTFVTTAIVFLGKDFFLKRQRALGSF
jgi:hypothetical protein